MGPIFAQGLGVHDLFATVEGDIFVEDDTESVSPLYVLVLGTFRSFCYYLAKSSQIVGIRFVPNVFLLGVASQFEKLKVLSCDFVNDRQGPVKD